MNGKAISWTAGAVVMALLLLAGSWFGLISPKLAETAEIVSQTEDVQARNDLLVIQNAKLAAQFAKLDEYREHVAEIAVKLPHDVELSELTRTLDSLAEDHEVTITTLAPSTPVEVLSPESEASAKSSSSSEDETVDGDESDVEDSPSEVDVDAIADKIHEDLIPGLPAVTVDGLFAVPVNVTLIGSLENVEALFEDLQTKIDRTFLVTEFTMTGQPEADASGGRPATEVGDVEVVLAGYVYMLQDEELAVSKIEELLGPVSPIDPRALPGNERNPFPSLTDGSSGSGTDSTSDEN